MHSTAYSSWHELARPQVHGYDLIDAVFLTLTRFISIADEKVARVFDAPRTFLHLCTQLGVLTDTNLMVSSLLTSMFPINKASYQCHVSLRRARLSVQPSRRWACQTKRSVNVRAPHIPNFHNLIAVF